jgi:aminoglycoside phosphotransferase family enzyme
MKNELIEALIECDLFGRRTRLIETHISWILLSGEFAHKIKKPLNLGFLDFSDLDKRLFYCQEEVRLNRRFGNDLYLDVEAIRGSVHKPSLSGGEPVIEYALRMRRFPQDALLLQRVTEHRINPEQMQELATVIFNFHHQIEKPICYMARKYGSPHTLITPIRQNLNFLKGKDHEHLDLVANLEQWTIESFETKLPLFQSRQSQGWIRECHGDLHLGNILYLNDQFTLFDCIEFSESLRWIDTMSDIGFLVMDLADKGAAALSNRLLNYYLELSGDYTGLEVLPFYIVYRALVRAKIHLLEASACGMAGDTARQSLHAFSHYLRLAREHTLEKPQFLAIMHGASGTGKTTCARLIADSTNAIQLRSDVERKRLFGLSALEKSTCVDIYTGKATNETFATLESHSRMLLAAGYSVIVDAVFMGRSLRKRFEDLACRQGAKFSIVSCVADAETVAYRLRQREHNREDASEAGYQQYIDQLKHEDPFTARERSSVLSINTGEDLPLAEVVQFLHRK